MLETIFIHCISKGDISFGVNRNHFYSVTPDLITSSLKEKKMLLC